MPEFHQQLLELEVERAMLRLGTELGRGQSGVVHSGSFRDERGHAIHVAVKSRVDSVVDLASSAAADEALLLEAMLLNALLHPGIVRLLAVVTIGAPLLVCTELMERGNLRDYLRACRSTTSRLTSVAEDDCDNQSGLAVVITPQLMLEMAAKLSCAVGFMAQKGIIHRDIAARNVLVGTSPTDVKMADLGAARNVQRACDLNVGGVYTATTDHVPARWMSLEALRNAQFSHASDVFAFGVLAWEIMSLGRTPWGPFGVADFAKALARGERLPLPPTLVRDSDEGESGIVAKVYEIALRCWKEDPAKRPRFHQLEAEFAIHHTVQTAGGAPRAPGSAPVAEDERFANGLVHRMPTKFIEGLPAVGSRADAAANGQNLGLDEEGYVADSMSRNESNLDEDGYVADGVSAHRPTLDEDGYVADGVSAHRPNLDGDGYDAICSSDQLPTHSVEYDADGYVADRSSRDRGLNAGDRVSSSRDTIATRPDLGVDRYVADTSSREDAAVDAGDRISCSRDANATRPDLGADGYVADHGVTQTSNAGTLATGKIVVGGSSDSPSFDSSEKFPRKGIAARSTRKPSVYLGFGEEQECGTRL
jgi:serine/threonine protein kinase